MMRHTFALAVLLVVTAALAGCSSTFTPRNVPAIVSFTATPGTILPGDSATVSWRVTEADSVVLDRGIGRVAADSGHVRVSPAATTDYTLTAYGAGGTRTASVTVRVMTSVPFCNEATVFGTTLACTPAAIASDVSAPVEIRTDFLLGATPRASFGGVLSPSVTMTGANTVLAVPPAGLPRGLVEVMVAASPGAPLIAVGQISVTGTRASAQQVPSQISGNLTLTAAGSPWRLPFLASVAAGATLTIEPGAVVLISGSGGITVQPGGRLMAGGGTLPAYLVPEDGRGVTHWGAVHMLAGSGPNALENVVCDGGGSGAAPGAVTLRGSGTVLCQLAVRGAQSAGLALALEAGAQFQTGTLWLTDNAGAGLLIDDGAGATGGNLTGMVQRNGGPGVLFLHAGVGTCGRWNRDLLDLRDNIGGNESGCP